MELASVIAVLAALAAAVQYLKRSGRIGAPAKRLTVEQRVPLSNGCQLVLVRLDNEELLLATGGSGCTLLTARALTPAPPPAVLEMRREQRACAG